MKLLIRQVLPVLAIAAMLFAPTAPAAHAQTPTNGDAIVVGVVSGVDSATRSFFVTTASGREVMVVAPDAKVTGVEGWTARFEDVRLFDTVWARGKVTDWRNMTADTIVILPSVEMAQQINRE